MKKGKMLIIFSIIAMLILSTSPVIATSRTGTQTIAEVFPDVNLATAIAEIIHNNQDISAPITEQSLLDIRNLTIPRKDIRDLSGIERLVNLEYLNADGNAITDISMLSKLPILTGFLVREQAVVLPDTTVRVPTKLILRNNDGAIPDFILSAEGSYSNEELVWISDGENHLNWQSSTPFGVFQGVVTQNVIQPEYTIAEIFADENLAKAVAWTLNGNENTEVHVTNQELSSITDLDATNRNIKSIIGIEYLPNITTLRLSNNQISDISTVSKLTNLEQLHAENNQVSDISVLSNLTNLRMYNLSNQTLVLRTIPINTPTSIPLRNLGGTTPTITFRVGLGTYRNGELVWSTMGENQLTWDVSSAIGQFTGTISQSVGQLYEININSPTLSSDVTSIPGAQLDRNILYLGSNAANTNIYRISGTTATRSIAVPNGNTANIIFDNLTIASDISSVQVHGVANILLRNSNSLSLNSNKTSAAIQVSQSGVINIDAIQNGRLIANGGMYAAGIGGNFRGEVGQINIKGGIITATGGIYSAGIGTGAIFATPNTFDIRDIDINISGGTITATGGSHGAGIGTGMISNRSSVSNLNINITGGDITATGGFAAAGIGAGIVQGNETALNNLKININNGNVTATGGNQGAGIGTGTLSSNKVGDIYIAIRGGVMKASRGASGQNDIGVGFANREEYLPNNVKVSITGGRIIPVH